MCVDVQTPGHGGQKRARESLGGTVVSPIKWDDHAVKDVAAVAPLASIAESTVVAPPVTLVSTISPIGPPKVCVLVCVCAGVCVLVFPSPPVSHHHHHPPSLSRTHAYTTTHSFCISSFELFCDLLCFVCCFPQAAALCFTISTRHKTPWPILCSLALTFLCLASGLFCLCL